MEFKVGDRVILKFDPRYKGEILEIKEDRYIIKWSTLGIPENMSKLVVLDPSNPFHLLLDKETMRDNKLKTLGI